MSKQTPIIKRFLFVPMLCLSAPATQAQQLATLSGAVTDQNSAVVANVRVRLVNAETGESYEAISSEGGNYTIPLIKPGSYELTAEANGFKSYKQTGIAHCRF